MHFRLRILKIIATSDFLIALECTTFVLSCVVGKMSPGCSNTLVAVFVCLFVLVLDCAKSLPAFFMKPCTIMDYSCGKNALNIWGLIVVRMADWPPLWIFVITYCIQMVDTNG